MSCPDTERLWRQGQCNMRRKDFAPTLTLETSTAQRRSGQAPEQPGAESRNGRGLEGKSAGATEFSRQLAGTRGRLPKANSHRQASNMRALMERCVATFAWHPELAETMAGRLHRGPKDVLRSPNGRSRGRSPHAARDLCINTEWLRHRRLGMKQ